MFSARSRHTATLLTDGKVLVVGGRDSSGTSIATAELYDPETGAWSSTDNLAIPRSYHTATLLADGRVLVAGGGHNFNGGPVIEKTVEIYDPNNAKWNFEKRTSVYVYHNAALGQSRVGPYPGQIASVTATPITKLGPGKPKL